MSVHISLAMMVKNEEKRIHVSLNSVIGVVDSLVIFDTGSEDKTIEIIKEFCDKQKLKLHLKQGEFVDFSTSRNVLLDFVDTISEIDYIVMLDCNDELKNANFLRNFAIQKLESPTSGWFVSQEWFLGVNELGKNICKYVNVRFVKPRTGWRYKGVVHEFIYNTRNEDEHVTDTVPNLIIYQDRTQDDDKSGKRFHRDRVLLEQEFEKYPTDARTAFYLAQTYDCIGMHEEAYKMYHIRTTLIGFYEEVFQSWQRMGRIAELLWKRKVAEFDEYRAIGCYLKAAEVCPRAEPYNSIADIYLAKNHWFLSYHFAKIACDIDFPVNDRLFIDTNVYEYHRYHILSIAAGNANKPEDGFWACKKAAKARPKSKVDQQNLKLFQKRLKNTFKK